MITKFVTMLGLPAVYTIEFEDETRTAWVHPGGIHEPKSATKSGNTRYHDTWEEARDYLVKETRMQLLTQKDHLRKLPKIIKATTQRIETIQGLRAEDAAGFRRND